MFTETAFTENEVRNVCSKIKSHKSYNDKSWSWIAVGAVGVIAAAAGVVYYCWIKDE